MLQSIPSLPTVVVTYKWQTLMKKHKNRQRNIIIATLTHQSKVREQIIFEEISKRINRNTIDEDSIFIY